MQCKILNQCKNVKIKKKAFSTQIVGSLCHTDSFKGYCVGI